MILLGRSSDKYRERRWHMAIPLVVGAAAIVCSALAGADNTGWAIFFLTIAAGGILAASPMFWSLPTAFLGGVSAAAGIAAINSVGNLAGFVAPYMIGSIKDLTQSTDIAIYLLAGILVIGAIIIMRVPAKLVNK
jgi:nitrate/nitrite transporter NarK